MRKKVKYIPKVIFPKRIHSQSRKYVTGNIRRSIGPKG